MEYNEIKDLIDDTFHDIRSEKTVYIAEFMVKLLNICKKNNSFYIDTSRMTPSVAAIVSAILTDSCIINRLQRGEYKGGFLIGDNHSRIEFDIFGDEVTIIIKLTARTDFCEPIILTVAYSRKENSDSICSYIDKQLDDDMRCWLILNNIDIRELFII